MEHNCTQYCKNGEYRSCVVAGVVYCMLSVYVACEETSVSTTLPHSVLWLLGKPPHNIIKKHVDHSLNVYSCSKLIEVCVCVVGSRRRVG